MIVCMHVVAGLTLELNIEQSEYMPALAQDAGVKIVIHERGSYPIPEDAGLSLPPGMKTSIGLDKVTRARLKVLTSVNACIRKLLNKSEHSSYVL